jgi:hypothetical protein
MTSFDPILEGLYCFFNDILVYSQNKEEHVRHLRVVFDTLVQHKLFAKWAKCKFASSEIDCLGHIVLGQGVEANPGKVKSMINWPKPKTLKSLRFFGLNTLLPGSSRVMRLLHVH